MTINFTIYIGCTGTGEKSLFGFKVGQPKKKKGAVTMLDLNITNEEKIKVTLSPKSAAGGVAAVDGKPVWTKTSGDGSIEVSDDGMSAFLVSGTAIGDTLYLVEADADLGEGVEKISDVIQLHVHGAKAASLGLVAGSPEPK